MTYRDHILNLPAQLNYQPQIINPDKLKPFKHVIVAGMGGSRMAPDILNMLRPDLDIHICSDYALPGLPQDYVQDSLVIANSHSGDTKETLDAAQAALTAGLQVAVVSQGGALAAWAQENNLPHIITPTTGAPARLSFGHSLKGLMALVGIDALPALADVAGLENTGKQIADALSSGIPVVYAPQHLNELGYAWKVILNETAKTPAFCNRYPELFHNEIASMDSPLAKQLCVLVLQEGESEKIAALLKFLASKEIPHTEVSMADIFSSIILAHWTALALAEKTGVDPISTPAIDEFKKSL